MGKICIELGCGNRKNKDCIGLDRVLLEGVDIVCDLEKAIPLRDGAVDKVYSNYFLEHVENIVFLFQEIYRVSKDGAIVEALVPYYTSINAFKDPTHKTFFTEETFRYFTKEKWYGSDYAIGTDFEILKIKYHYSKIAQILFPFRKYLRRHFINMVGALSVTLKVVKK